MAVDFQAGQVCRLEAAGRVERRYGSGDCVGDLGNSAVRTVVVGDDGHVGGPGFCDCCDYLLQGGV